MSRGLLATIVDLENKGCSFQDPNVRLFSLVKEMHVCVSAFNFDQKVRHSDTWDHDNCSMPWYTDCYVVVVFCIEACLKEL